MSTRKARVTLLSLPLELRLRIYSILLVDREAIMPKFSSQKPLSPALLRVCKAVFNEATPILYKANNFNLNDSVSGLTWLKSIGKTNPSYLRTVRIFVDGYLHPLAEKAWYQLIGRLAKQATGLRFVESVYFDAEGMLRGYGHQKELLKMLATVKGLDLTRVDGVYDRAFLRECVRKHQMERRRLSKTA